MKNNLIEQMRKCFPRSPRGRKTFVGVLTLVLLLLVAGGVLWHVGQGRAAAEVTPPASAVPAVAVVQVGREDLYKELSIPAEFRPYQEVDLHAKVSGYLTNITVDIGDRVKAGQLLASLEMPELHDELNSALAAQHRAEADYQNAHLVYTRLTTVNQSHANLVAQQDLDAAEAHDAAAAAAIAVAKADAEKYETLLKYTRIAAPFDGVITKRYVDNGALIQSGTASQTQSLPVVRLSDNYRLRLDFPVSVDYVKDIQPGTAVTIRVESLGQKMIEGKVTRLTDRVDDATRTMIVETEIANPDLELVPGMYAYVNLKVEQHPQALAIPVEAVTAGKGYSALVVTSTGELELRPLKLGLETPGKYEVLDGLKEGDLVMLGNPEQLRPGAKVEPKILRVQASQ